MTHIHGTIRVKRETAISAVTFKITFEPYDLEEIRLCVRTLSSEEALRVFLDDELKVASETSAYLFSELFAQNHSEVFDVELETADLIRLGLAMPISD